jgi:multidrug resistance efflux pump
MAIRIVIFILVAAALAGVLYYSQLRHEPDKVSGFIEAHDVRVGSRIGGRIAKVDVDEGAAVKAGDVLVELDPYDLNQRLAQAQALLVQRRAEYDRLKNGFRPEEIAQAAARRDQLAAELDKAVAGPRPPEITEAQALLDQAVRERDLAQATYNRTSKSFAASGVSQEEMDQTTNQLRVTQANLIVRQQQLDLLKEGTRKEDIDSAKAQLAQAQQALDLMKNGNRKEDIDAASAAVDSQAAAVAALQKQIEELKVLAPAAGVIEAVDIRPGDLLSPNAPALSMLESDELWVRAYVPENALDIKKGQKVRVTVDSYPGRDFSGEVTFVSRDAEFTPENVQTVEKRSKQVFRIRVTLTGPGKDDLRAGMSADVWLK